MSQSDLLKCGSRRERSAVSRIVLSEPCEEGAGIQMCFTGFIIRLDRAGPGILSVPED